MGNLLQMLEGSKTAQRNTKITELGSKLSTLREEVRIASTGSWGGPHRGGTQVSGGALPSHCWYSGALRRGLLDLEL